MTITTSGYSYGVRWMVVPVFLETGSNYVAKNAHQLINVHYILIYTKRKQLCC
ncbi:MAG: hypothetical protein ABJB11_02710 [Ferruginibacter sp.]